MAGPRPKRKTQAKAKPESQANSVPLLPTADLDSCLQRLPHFEENSVLTNGVFVQIVRDVFMPMIKQFGELTATVQQLRADNASIQTELQNQQEELRALRKQLAVQAAMSYIPMGANAAGNVLIHGVPEAADETALNLRQCALKYLGALKTTTEILDHDVLSVTRLGLSAKEGRQRPLVVKLKDVALPALLSKASYQAYQADPTNRRNQPYVTRHLIRKQDYAGQPIGQTKKRASLYRLHGTRISGAAKTHRDQATPAVR